MGNVLNSGLPTTPACTVERFMVEVEARTYIDNYRRADYFMDFCRQCGNFGRRHGCPPFDYDPLSVIGHYRMVRIVGVKVTPADRQLPLDLVNDLLAPVMAAVNDEMLAEEQSSGGYYCGFVGTCPYCGDEPCARIAGQPCRHPDRVRPSLEAFGFDLTKTAKDLLGLDIKWSRGDFLPEYLTLICGLFY